MSVRGVFRRAWGAIAGRPSRPQGAWANNGDYLSGVRTALASSEQGGWDGSKFAGGYDDGLAGWNELLPDMVALRARSANLFTSNPYARGIIRRLITNEIHTGLLPEACPHEGILGLEEGDLVDWAEDVEVRWGLWAESPEGIADYRGMSPFSEIQKNVRREAIVGGDTLVILRNDKLTGEPVVQVIPAHRVVDPGPKAARHGADIVDGVEVDRFGKHVAYYVQVDGKPDAVRIRAYGRSTGRRLAWLVYGSDRRVGRVRGEPLLGILLQSLREIDKYRDSAQRKALINSLIAVFIKREVGTPNSNAFNNAGVVQGDSDAPAPDRKIKMHPGIALADLNPGETPQGFQSDGTDINFRDFEEAIVCTMAWTLQIPPEVLRLSYSSNYAASQAANNEFNIYVGERRHNFANQFLKPVYVDWLYSQVIAGRVKARGLVAAMGDRVQYLIVGAWTAAEWTGAVKPTADPVKMAKAFKILIEELGVTTRHHLAKVLGFGKWNKNVRLLRLENEKVAEAKAPLAALAVRGGATDAETNRPPRVKQAPNKREDEDEDDDDDNDDLE